MTAVYRPGSKVQSVWEAYESGGADAAIKKGQALGLAPSTIKMWVRDGKWMVPPPGQREKKQPEAASSKAAPHKHKGEAADTSVATPIKLSRKANVPGRKRICLTSDPRCLGWLIREGEQQSEVVWDNGNVNTVEVNRWVTLIDAEGNPIAKRKTREETERAIQVNRGINPKEKADDDSTKPKPATRKGKKGKTKVA